VGLNLGLGVFLVWRRHLDGVARLLGLAMAGPAAAFNLQAHTPFATVIRRMLVDGALTAVVAANGLTISNSSMKTGRPHQAQWKVAKRGLAGTRWSSSPLPGAATCLLSFRRQCGTGTIWQPRDTVISVAHDNAFILDTPQPT
jgi:hypothetical protein